MLRTSIVLSALAAVALFARASTADEVEPIPDCPNLWKNEPVVILDTSGATLLGPVHENLIVYSSGLVAYSRAAGHHVSKEVRTTQISRAEVGQLVRDLRDAGAMHACDQAILFLDVPMKSLTVLNAGSNASAHTVNYWAASRTTRRSTTSSGTSRPSSSRPSTRPPTGGRFSTRRERGPRGPRSLALQRRSRVASVRTVQRGRTVHVRLRSGTCQPRACPGHGSERNPAPRPRGAVPSHARGGTVRLRSATVRDPPRFGRSGFPALPRRSPRASDRDASSSPAPGPVRPRTRRRPARRSPAGPYRPIQEKVMLRSSLIVSALAAAALFAGSTSADEVEPAPSCVNLLRNEPVLVFDVTGSTLAGPVHENLIVYSSGFVAFSRAESFSQAMAVRTGHVSPDEVARLLRDLADSGAGVGCDQAIVVTDVPMKSLTTLAAGTNARAHTINYFGGEPFYEAIDEIVGDFRAQVFPID